MPNKIQHHWRLGMKHVGHAARFGHRHYNYAKATLGNATNMVTGVATAANSVGLLGDSQANALLDASMKVDRGLAAAEKVEGAVKAFGTSASKLQKGGATTAGIVDTMGAAANLRESVRRK